MIGLINGSMYDSAGQILSSGATIITAGTDLIASIVEDNPGTYYLASGTHVTSTALDFTKLSNVHIIGLPGAVLQQDGANSIISGTEPSNTQYGIAAVTSGDRLITTDTAGDAGNFSAGDIIRVTDGTDQMCNEVLAVNAGTGVIDTVYSWGSAFGAAATVEVISSTPTENFSLSNVTIDSNGQTTACFACKSGGKVCAFKDIYFKGGETTGGQRMDNAFFVDSAFQNISTSIVEDHGSPSVAIGRSTACLFDNITMLGDYPSGNTNGITLSQDWYCSGRLKANRCASGVYINRGGGSSYDVVTYENVSNGVVGATVEYTTFTGVSRNNGTNSSMSGTTNTAALQT